MVSKQLTQAQCAAMVSGVARWRGLQGEPEVGIGGRELRLRIQKSGDSAPEEVSRV